MSQSEDGEPEDGWERTRERTRRALVAFYSVHNRDKVAEVDTILARFEGKYDSLAELLERKYSVSLASFASGISTQAGTVPLPPASAPAALPADHARLAALEAQNGQLRSAHEAEREARIQLGAQLKSAQAKLATSVDRQTAQEQALSLHAAEERAHTLEQELQTAKAGVDAKHEQLLDALHAQHALRVQLDCFLAAHGREADPYRGEDPVDNDPTPARVDEQEGDGARLALAAARAEIGLLLRERADAQRRAEEQAREVSALQAQTRALRDRLNEESGSTNRLQETMDEKEHEIAAARAEARRWKTHFDTERATHASCQAELEHTRAVLLTAAEARRELAVVCRRQRQAVEQAARQRVAEAHSQVALQHEELLSQEFELLTLQRNAAEQEKDSAHLELNRLSRLVHDIRAEKNARESECSALRAELRRAAQGHVHGGDGSAEIPSTLSDGEPVARQRQMGGL